MKSSKGVVLLIVGIIFSVTTSASAATPIRVVNGIFKDVDGRPVANREAIVYSADGLTTFVTSDAQGKFRTQVRNGQIAIQLVVAGLRTSNRTINLTSADTEISIIFPGLKTYIVNVKDSNGVGVADVQTSICAGDHSNVTQSDGQVLTFSTQCELGGWSNETGKTSITGFELANQNYLTVWDWNRNGENDGLITYYYPFEGVQLAIYTEMSDWADGRVDVVLPDVPSIDFVAPTQIDQGESMKVQVTIDPATTPLNFRAAQPTSISSFSGSQVQIWSRSFVNPRKPGNWIQGKSAKVSAKGVAAFSVSPGQTTQFQIRGSSISASSKPFTVRVKAAIAYKSCTTLNKAHKGGVAKSKLSKNLQTRNGKKVVVKSKFKASLNSALYSANKNLDKDKDGIVCEK